MGLKNIITKLKLRLKKLTKESADLAQETQQLQTSISQKDEEVSKMKLVNQRQLTVIDNLQTKLKEAGNTEGLQSEGVLLAKNINKKIELLENRIVENKNKMENLGSKNSTNNAKGIMEYTSLLSQVNVDNKNLKMFKSLLNPEK